MVNDAFTKLWVIHSPGLIYWRLPYSGLLEVDFGPISGMRLVTPLGCASMGLSDIERSTKHDEYFAANRAIVLRCIPEIDSEVITSVLSILRYVSRQFMIPKSVAVMTMEEAPPYVGTPSDILRSKTGASWAIRDYIFQTAITEHHLHDVTKLPVNFTAPIHSEILLDSLEAHINLDYRKSILYAAMAVESLAQEKLEDLHSKAIAANSQQHRVISMPLPGGNFLHKDPIYDLISMGDDFGRLLHERPLYLLGRSILVEKPEVYRLARQLYSTRNKIVHRGTVPDDQKFFPLNHTGSSEGLVAAIEVFKWFGEIGPYVIGHGIIQYKS
jgi:hypothetical protein